MSIENAIFGVGCNQEIYDTPDEETWVQCKVGKAKLGMIVGIIILTIIILIFVFLGGYSRSANILAVILGFLIAGLIVYSTYNWSERMARVEWKRFDVAVGTEVEKFGVPRAEAVKNYIEKVQKEKDRQTQIRASSQQAGALLSIAGALKRRR